MTRKPKQLARDLFTDDLSSVEGLAQLITATMNHPLCPDSLYNAIADEVCEMGSYIKPDYTPEHIARCLEANARVQKEGEAA
jgi:hypothetical protein